MTITTGLSGNEIYCLAQKGYTPGNIVVGNSVHSLGISGMIGSGLRALMGGEIEQVTSLIEEGRQSAYQRMQSEANALYANGITGVTSQLIFHSTNVEFLSIGSTVNSENSVSDGKFSTSADGQELFAQLDAGYKPICFAFGNVAYSMGISRGIIGKLKTLARGEIKEFSDIFNHTRHLALERIVNNARQQKANAVLGIKTTILPFSGINEMLMVGTASHNPHFAPSDDIITSDMSNVEMWNMAKLGYAPMRLVLGTSIYSLGLVGGISSTIKSFFRGEINELTRLIYEARENALGIINREAQSIGADAVVGVKTYVYELHSGLIEFLVIGTAVRKIPTISTESEQLPPQALVVDTDSFYNSANINNFNITANEGSKPINNRGFLDRALVVIAFIVFTAFFIFNNK